MEQKTEQSFWARRWKLIINLITLAALGVFVWALRADIVNTFYALGRVNAWFLLLLIPIQFLNYDAQVRLYQSVMRIEGTVMKYWKLMRATLELNFVNNVFPSGGVTGITYFGLRLKSKDFSPAKVTAVYTMKLILLFLSFEVLIAIGVFALAISGKMNNLILVLSATLITTLILFTLGLMFVVGSKRRIAGFFAYISKWINKIARVFRRKKSSELIKIESVKSLFEEMNDYYKIFSSNWRLLAWPMFWAFMANLWEVMTIFVVYLAFGDVVNIGAIILAYAVANSAGFVSVLPGGVGIYEALMTVVLTATGVPSRISLPVTIMYRVLSTLIQVPIGYVFYQHYISNLKPKDRQVMTDKLDEVSDLE